MKTKLFPVRLLRVSALIILLSGLGIWAYGGARLGWTQTSVITLQHDEVTGIEYPVRRNAFGRQRQVRARRCNIGDAGRNERSRAAPSVAVRWP